MTAQIRGHCATWELHHEAERTRQLAGMPSGNGDQSRDILLVPISTELGSMVWARVWRLKALRKASDRESIVMAGMCTLTSEWIARESHLKNERKTQSE